jgi:hypothetical protein
MKVLALVSGLIFLVLCSILSSFSWRSPELRLTVRRQFDDWHDLLQLFKDDQNISDFTQRALSVAWCNHTLPPQSVRAPFCDCVQRAADSFANRSAEGKPSSEDSVMKLVACMSSRPTWRVKQFWAVRYTTPAIYVLFIATCFLVVASDIHLAYLNVGLWFISAVFVVILVVADTTYNSFWAFTFLLVVLLINWILLPGMASSTDSPSTSIKRTPSCFWWSEYLSAPIFALYVPLMHCGRDFVFASIFTMIGTAIGGLGLRSFWCAEVYSDGPKKQFQSLMQRIVWFGILTSCVSLSMFSGIYYNSDVPMVMGPMSIVLLVFTMIVSLLQWPGNQNFEYLLETQIALAGIRDVMMFAVALYDVISY